MSTLSEGELHVQAMRLVCEALADREKTGLEVDWDVINQQLDHMDVILQGIADQRVDDADEIKTLRKQLDAAQAETVDVRRQRNNETDRLNATNAVSVQQRDEIAYLRTRLDEERSVSAGLRQQLDATRAEVETLREQLADAQLAVSDAFAEVNSVRQQLDAANAAVSLQRAGIERLQAFAGKVRKVYSSAHPHNWMSLLRPALAELDAGTEPAPVAEPIDAEGDTCPGN